MQKKNLKNWGARSWDRVRGSIGLGNGLVIGIGLGVVVNMLLFLRNALLPPPPPKKKVDKSPS